MAKYFHPRKTPKTEMYAWLRFRSDELEAKENNELEAIAVYWYNNYRQLEEILKATPIKVYWESFKEQFPDATVNYGDIKDDILLLTKENERLMIENTNLRTTYEALSMAISELENKVRSKGEL